jgi:hypothetical protein
MGGSRYTAGRCQGHAATAPVHDSLAAEAARSHPRAGRGILNPASGPDTYRCFVFPTNLARDAYVSAIDFRPRNVRVVHHINAFLDTTGAARARDEAERGPGYTSFSGPSVPIYEDLGFWAAGHEPHHLPDGIGQRLNKQSDVILQVHYHPTGKPEVDRTRIGIYFSRVPVKQALHWSTASNSEFVLPAGQSNIEVKRGVTKLL